MKSFARFLSWLARWFLQPLLVVAVLAGGFLGAKKLASMRAGTPAAGGVEYAPLVHAAPVVVERIPVFVRGNGTLRALNPIQVVAQVGGRIVAVHDGLRPGGRFGAGETLVEIEKDDYQLAVALANADLVSARAALQVQQAEADNAKEEWRRLRPDEPVPPLVARAPQIAEATARVTAAEARLGMAALNLTRTTIALAVDGRVLSESVDVGQVVAPNQVLATTYRMDDLEVPVPVETEALGWIALPGDGDENGEAAGATGSIAAVRCPVGEEMLTLRGRVARLLGEVDETSRMAHVVVRVDTTSLTAGQRRRILPGLFVDVEIDAGALDGVVRLPRAAVRENGVVWVVVGERIEFARPTVVRADGDDLLVTGLADGALVVRSDLEVVTDGMKVRVAQ